MFGIDHKKRLASMAKPGFTDMAPRDPKIGLGPDLAANPGAGLTEGLAAVAAGGPPSVKKPGLMDRIGMALEEPGMRAALLRSAGATLQGGLGAGIQAGASFMDQRRRDDANTAHMERADAIDAINARSNADYRSGMLENVAFDNQLAMAKAEQDARVQAAREGLEWAKLSQDEQLARLRAQVDMRGQDVSRANAETSAAASRYGADRSAAASIYGTNVNSADRFMGRAFDNRSSAETTTLLPDGSTQRRTQFTPSWGSSYVDASGNEYVVNPATGQYVPTGRRRPAR